jgi:hypothetical protein
MKKTYVLIIGADKLFFEQQCHHLRRLCAARGMEVEIAKTDNLQDGLCLLSQLKPVVVSTDMQYFQKPDTYASLDNSAGASFVQAAAMQNFTNPIIVYSTLSVPDVSKVFASKGVVIPKSLRVLPKDKFNVPEWANRVLGFVSQH